MPAPPVKRAATYQDLVALPDNVVGEIVDGELFASPRPSARHAGAATGLQGSLFGPFDRRGGGGGGWFFLFEPELHIVGQVLVPDLAGWRRERMPELPDTPALTLAPDWVCEVLSPSTAVLDRTSKVHHYAKAGVGHMWLLDPAVRTLEVFRLESPGWVLAASVAGETRTRLQPFESVELDLAAVWGR